jgi:membrane protein implicated in regulation of membrane protease activity
LTVALSASVSAGVAIISAIITYVLTRKREHRADWRKLKLNQYQEFLLALSGVVRERATPEGKVAMRML